MGTTEDLARLRGALAVAVRKSARTRQELSSELGRNPHFVSGMLRGKSSLRVEEVFHLLSVLGVRPLELFGHCFPLGGEVVARMRAEHLPQEQDPESLHLRDLADLATWKTSGLQLTSVAWTLKAGRLLTFKIRQAGRNQADAARALGISPAALSRRLRGDTQLTLEVVFALLEEIGVAPGRFFAELLGAPSEELMDELRWSWFLDRAEAHLRAVAEATERDSRVKSAGPAAPRSPGGTAPRGSRKGGRQGS